MIFSRANLRKNKSIQSAEPPLSAGDVGFYVDPQQPRQNMEKHAFKTNFWASERETLGIDRNAFSQSLAAVWAMFTR